MGSILVRSLYPNSSENFRLGRKKLDLTQPCPRTVLCRRRSEMLVGIDIPRGTIAHFPRYSETTDVDEQRLWKVFDPKNRPKMSVRKASSLSMKIGRARLLTSL